MLQRLRPQVKNIKEWNKFPLLSLLIEYYFNNISAITKLYYFNNINKNKKKNSSYLLTDKLFYVMLMVERWYNL